MKTVLITGAAKNLGFAIARRYAKAGYAVAVTSRSSERASETAGKLEKEYGVRAKGYAMELRSVGQITEVFASVEKDFGSLDVFIANAAELGMNNTVASTAEEDYHRIIDTNLKGTFFCCREAALCMKRHGGGSIVTIGSVQGEGAVPGRALYSMSKAAIVSLVKTLAFEFGEYGVRANNLSVGAVHTVRWDELSEEALAAWRSRYPAGRESTEEEVAEAAFFLGDTSSPTLTGTSMTIDSGISACMVPYKKTGGTET